MWYVIALVVIVALAITFWQYLLALAAAYLAWIVIRHIRMRRYFDSPGFRAHKEEVAAVVHEHNEILEYVTELRQDGSFTVGASESTRYAHLASFVNTSRYGYRRDRHIGQYSAPTVHHGSLQMVRNAKQNPVKSFIRHFLAGADEESLERVELLGETISRLENAIANLRTREAALTDAFCPPPFILKHYQDEFMSQVGVQLSPINVPYPQYRFEYVSAGGNSSQHAGLTLNTPTIDALIEEISTKIRFRQSAAGQRALMTAALRSEIKNRDGHTCRTCLVSVAAEPHLLLEVDHIVPVSRGGLSVRENLQTLCWRCNRSKSNKMAA